MILNIQSKLERLLIALFFVALGGFIVLHATQPIYDPDFWWHLKTGEVMVEQRGLLHSDPFTFTGSQEVSLRESLILKGYWLWEITAYLLYRLLGFNGIFTLNIALAGAIAWVSIQRFQRLEVSWHFSAPLLAASFILLREYPLERPQVVSFLFATVLMGLLTEICRERMPGWILPLVMLLWANLHSGHLIGSIMLSCFALGVIIEYRKDHRRVKPLLLWSAAGVGASLLNPVGGLAAVETLAFLGKPLQTGIMEYKSTWAEFQEGRLLIPMIIWSLMGLYGISILLARRICWWEFFIATFLGYISARYIRNTPFFGLAILPLIGFYWSEIYKKTINKLTRTISIVFFIASTLILIYMTVQEWRISRNSLKVSPIYPQAAADFIIKNNMKGRMFNSYEYGGYLLWRLYPEFRVFIDGRGLNPTIFEHYGKIVSASREITDGKIGYENLLDYYKIDYIIQPIYDGYGNVQPLMEAILSNNYWIPVYLDTQVYIFARTNGENIGKLNDNIISKTEFGNRLLLIYDFLIRNNPEEVSLRVARAGLLIFLSRTEEAAKEVKFVESVKPTHPGLANLRQRLHLQGNKIPR